MLRRPVEDEQSISAIVPAQTVMWAGGDTAPESLRDLLSELGYALLDRDLAGWPARRVSWLSAQPLQGLSTYDLSARRIAVVHPDAAAADALAEALRAQGARVIVMSPDEDGLERAEALEPDLVLLQPERFWPDGRSAVTALWQHPWLRWTPVLFVPAERLGSAAASNPDVRELALGIHALCADYDLTQRRARREEAFELRLSQLGPVRTLRALLESHTSLRLTLEAPERQYELDLGDGLVLGARVRVQRGMSWDELHGEQAVKSFLARMTGQVRVAPAVQPARADVMTPLAVLLLGGRAAPALEQPLVRTVGTRPPKQASVTPIGRPTPIGRALRSGASAAQSVPVVRAARALDDAAALPVQPRRQRAREHARKLLLVAALLAALAGAFWAGSSYRERFEPSAPALQAFGPSPGTPAPGSTPPSAEPAAAAEPAEREQPSLDQSAPERPKASARTRRAVARHDRAARATRAVPRASKATKPGL